MQGPVEAQNTLPARLGLPVHSHGFAQVTVWLTDCRCCAGDLAAWEL